MVVKRLSPEYFTRDALEVAPDLINKILVRKFSDGTIIRTRITETEAYRGEEDLACHASKGKTPRTQIMYEKGGVVYMYLIYGMYQMLNFVVDKENNPQAVLIRGIEGFNGPGKLTRFLKLDKSFYGEDLSNSDRIWVEDDGTPPECSSGKRIGIDYAGEWKDKPWRFFLTLH